MSADPGLGFLAEAGRALGESLDLDATFARVARLCVPALADVALFDLLGEGGPPRRVAAAAAAPELDALAQELLRYPPRSDGEHPIFEAVRTGTLALLREVSEEMLRKVAHDERHFEVLRALRFDSVIEAPLIARGSVFGVLTLARSRGGAYADADLGLIEELARRAAVAVDHARTRFAEQSARRSAEDAASRTLRLLSVTEGLEDALEPEEVARVILQRGLRDTGAAGAVVTRIDGDELEVLAFVGYPSPVMNGPLRRVPLRGDLPIAIAAHTGETVLLGSAAEWSARFDPAIAAASPNRSWAALPLSIRGRRIGALGVSYSHERSFSREDRDFLAGLASQCAQALHRAQLFAEEHRARAAAEEAVRAREEFLSIASHELRTPLTPLMLQLGILRRSIEPALVPRVEIAQRQTERLARLVENLLDVSRIGLGSLQIERQEIDLEPLIRALQERFGEEARKQGCALVFHTAPVRGSWDGLRIEQVATNLLSNALKYGAGKPVEVRLWSEEGRARLSVADGGIGIAPGDQQRIFGRFERAVSSREYSGIGLGLYIARQIVEAHGGSISVRSTPGEGSTFLVDLPLRA